MRRELRVKNGQHSALSGRYAMTQPCFPYAAFSLRWSIQGLSFLSTGSQVVPAAAFLASIACRKVSNSTSGCG
jgi:hypothetical protein